MNTEFTDNASAAQTQGTSPAQVNTVARNSNHLETFTPSVRFNVDRVAQDFAKRAMNRQSHNNQARRYFMSAQRSCFGSASL